MKKMTYVGIALLIVIAVILGYNISSQIDMPKTSPAPQAVDSQDRTIQQNTNTQQNNQQTGTSNANNITSIPENHPNMVQKPQKAQTATIYTLNGEVESFSGGAGGELVLRSKGAPLPTMKLAKNVEIVKAVDKSKSSPSTPAEIKPGTTVTLIVMYDQNTKSWDITHVTIIPAGI